MKPHQNEGGAAFPGKYEYLHEDMIIPDHSPGMSLLDWFAGMALQGMLASCRPGYSYETRRDAAREAYEYADAMLAARKEVA